MTERVPGARAVFLVGFMGAGKTSVGRALGLLLELPFQDLDDVIRSREGRTIEDIFTCSGETEFRRLEYAALREIVSSIRATSRIVGLGGGAFVQTANQVLLEETGEPTVFLDAAVDELWRRCQAQAVERPLQKDESQFRQLYAKRRPAYLKAVVSIDTTGKSVDMVAREVASRLGLENRVDLKES